MIHQGLVIPSRSELPGNLAKRTPHSLKEARLSFRVPREEALDADGRVLVPGAVEFRSGITPGALSNVCDPNELWAPEQAESERFKVVYDPQIQRGEKEKAGKMTPILKEDNITSMVSDILKNEFECPELMWNLRFGEVLWVYVEDERELLIYEGTATRPDTNHRHHAIVRTHRQYRKWERETGDSQYENYNPEREYALAVYTDNVEGEAHKFFVLNTKGSKVAPGKAHFVASLMSEPHAHAKLAKDLMRGSGVLTERNVEISQSTLSKNSTKMVLFYTLVRGLQAAFPSIPGDDEDRKLLLDYLVEFVGELSKLRPDEIALLSLDKRQKVREESIADQAITWIGYLDVAATLRGDPAWKKKLAVLGEPYSINGKSGDLFKRANPLWVQKGLLVKDAKDKFKVVSNRNAQQQMVVTLREIVNSAAAE